MVVGRRDVDTVRRRTRRERSVDLSIATGARDATQARVFRSVDASG
jgi:hypothetical protein